MRLFSSLIAVGVLAFCVSSTANAALSEAESASFAKTVATYQESSSIDDLISRVGQDIRPSHAAHLKKMAAMLKDKRLPKLTDLGHGRYALKLGTSLIAYEPVSLARNEFLVNNKRIVFSYFDTPEAQFQKIEEALPKITWPETAAHSILNWFFPGAEAQQKKSASYGGPAMAYAVAISTMQSEASRQMECSKILVLWDMCNRWIEKFSKADKAKADEKSKEEQEKAKVDPKQNPALCSENRQLGEAVYTHAQFLLKGGKDNPPTADPGGMSKPIADQVNCPKDAESAKKAMEAPVKTPAPITPEAKAKAAQDKKDGKKQERVELKFEQVESCKNTLVEKAKEQFKGKKTIGPHPVETCYFDEKKAEKDKKNAPTQSLK